MLKNLKIRNKILISILSINFVILTTIFIVYYNFSKDIILEETREKALVKVEELKKSLSGFLNEKAKIGWNLSNAPWVKDWLRTNTKRLIADGEDAKFDEVKKYMVDLKRNDGQVESVFLACARSDMYYDDKGYRVDDTYRVTTRPWYQKAIQIGKPSFDFDADYSSGKIFVNYRNPVYDTDGSVLGISGIDISLKFLNTFLENAGTFESAEVSLISTDGTILFNPDSTLIMKKKLSEYTDDGENFENVANVAAKIMNGETNFEKVVYKGENKYFLFSKMDNLDWSILLSVNEDEINAPLNSLTGTSVIILLISLIGLSIAIVLLANSISRPIIEFTRDITQITKKGSLDYTITFHSNDEIGELSNSVNQMMQAINSKITAADQISQGYLDVNIDIISDDDLLGKAMDRMKRRISALINEIEKLSKATLEGNLAYRTDSSNYKGDYKKILDGINQTVETLLNPITEAAKTLQFVTARDLTTRMNGDYQGDNATLKNNLNQAIQNLDTALQQVSRTLLSHTNAANQISNLTEEMSMGMEKQSAQTVEVATAVEEMTSTIFETSQNAHLMAETANAAKVAAERGGNVVQKTINGMKTISEKVNESAKVVQALGKSSEEIGEIISVINDIADQTNLLALNAAIEAARAGEQGRGFAVVADEVRKLAERTTKATKEIEEMIKKIQRDTNEAVNSMESGKDEVESGIKLADEAGVALKEIVQISVEVTERVAQIAAANEEQSAVSENISRNIETINNLSQQTSSGMQLISQHVEDFKDLTAHLQKLNSAFRISQGNPELSKYLNM